MNRGEIFWANLSPTIGSEISKTRPVLIVSNDANNEHADTVTILPITSSTSRIYPFEVLVPSGQANLTSDSKVKANQIRTIDKRRIGNKIGALPPKLLGEIEQAILIHLDITS
ncbi:MAG: type II toxin-antitoxin system PemK/MazF family toxin [Lewinellaceae bacterium]|nr:type II toxin-antitoxin system PemK/MazF family toxin [Lewinellaceae bacterium]